MEEEANIEENGQMIQGDDVVLPSDLEITERMTEMDISYEQSTVLPSSNPSESQHSLEIATSVSGGTTIHMNIFTIDNSSMFSRKSLTRKSI